MRETTGKGAEGELAILLPPPAHKLMAKARGERKQDA